MARKRDPEGVLVMESRSDFLGGRARVTVRPTEKAKQGQTGTVTVFLFTPDENQRSAKIGFRIEKPDEEPTSGNQSRAQVQAPTPIMVFKDEWSIHDWNESSVSEVKDDEKGTNRASKTQRNT